MESMVRGALGLFRGLDDDETSVPIDINALVATLQSEFAEMSGKVVLEGRDIAPMSVPELPIQMPVPMLLVPLRLPLLTRLCLAGSCPNLPLVDVQ